MDGYDPNRYEEHVPSIVIPMNGEGIQDEGVQDDHLDDVFIASQTLHDIDDVRDDYEDSDCELIVNGCDNVDDDIQAQDSTHHIPTMEAPITFKKLVPHPRAFMFRGRFLLLPSSRAKGTGAGGTVVGMSEGRGEYVWVEPGDGWRDNWMGGNWMGGQCGMKCNWVGGMGGVTEWVGWVVTGPDGMGGNWMGGPCGMRCGLCGMGGNWMGGLCGMRCNWVGGLSGMRGNWMGGMGGLDMPPYLLDEMMGTSDKCLPIHQPVIKYKMS
uniref:Uncharacterized protein n=1 Tax=Fagus sylvatica TaxID=28930 RepID=A0A2N9I3B8_FAGSY